MGYTINFTIFIIFKNKHIFKILSQYTMINNMFNIIFILWLFYNKINITQTHDETMFKMTKLPACVPIQSFGLKYSDTVYADDIHIQQQDTSIYSKNIFL
jgi:hypothetical protein